MAALGNLLPAPARHDRHDRRGGEDRRTHTLRALVAGNFNPRRYGPRRARDASLASTDRYDVRWLAIGIAILLLSAVDALLTLTLLQHGALEANPLMAAFLHRFPGAFVDVKIGLTAGGVVLLVMFAKVRAFGGRLPVSFVLYAVLAAYVALIGYEVWILRTVAKL